MVVLELRSHSWALYFLPYLFQKIRSDRFKFKHLYLPLNRYYKPLGYIGTGRVDYSAYADVAVVFRRDPATFKGVWYPSPHYLYDDSPSSREDYFERLAALMTHAMPLAGIVGENPSGGGWLSSSRPG